MAHFEWVKYMVCELYLNKTVNCYRRKRNNPEKTQNVNSLD